MNGTLSKGNGEPALLPPPEPEASVEPGKNDTMQPPEMEKETIPLVPVPAKIEKPKKKPKIEPVPKPPKKQEIIAKTENPMPPAAPAVTNSDARNPSGASLSGQEEGLGGDAGEGDNVGHPKTGTGSGARGINGQGGDTVGFGGGEWG
jgi:outer membrane biosynthesis protein TonB